MSSIVHVAGMMRHRSHAYAVFDGVQTKFRKLRGSSISKLHMDGDQEYIALQNSLGEGEEDDSFSQKQTPESGGIAGRVNRSFWKGIFPC